MAISEGLKIAIEIFAVVAICTVIIAVVVMGRDSANKGLSQAAKMTSSFNDMDKQKYDGMTINGDTVQQVIREFWLDPTCEIVVCTLDGINAVYNQESTDGTYTVPFSEALTGMPTSDCKGRVFPSDTSISDTSALTPSAYVNEAASVGTGGVTYDVASVVNYNLQNGAPTGNAIIVDAAKLVQGPGNTNKILAASNGYNTDVSVGTGGYISTASNFIGSVQKDANGTVRRITFVQL